MNGVLKSILADTLQARSMGDGVGEAFPWISKPFLQFYPITPVLQHSTTPSTPGSEGTRSAPSRGLKTKPRPLGVDSLLDGYGQEGGRGSVFGKG